MKRARTARQLATLRKILNGLGITMSEFFDPDTQSDSQVFFTPDELRDLTSQIYSQARGAEGKISFMQVGSARLHNLQILHESYEPNADTGEEMLEHVGNEGGIIVSGEIELTVGDRIQVLKAGDSYLFDSREPHRFRNISNRPATVVSACTPPYL